MIAKNTTVSSTVNEDQASEKKLQSALNTLEAITKKTCFRGHDLSLYHRADGVCGRCHTLRNQKWRREKGKAFTKYHDMKKQIKRRMRLKREKIEELEGLLNDQENKN